MGESISPEIGSKCEQCGRETGVNESVIVPATTDTYTIVMCQSCRLELLRETDAR